SEAECWQHGKDNFKLAFATAFFILPVEYPLLSGLLCDSRDVYSPGIKKTDGFAIRARLLRSASHSEIKKRPTSYPISFPRH
ncbi:hypothetical protein OFN52_34050, partial [Escherichia coli]|nr:hypothetical protein [Escherichia coli]